MHRTKRFGLLLAAALVFSAGCLHGAQVAVQPQVASVPDVDEDGIPDDIDECVTEKEDHKAPRPDDGCKADPNDLDGDGLVASDKCPSEPETQNGYEDEDGCPDEMPKETATVVTVTQDELKCCVKILFGTGQANVAEVSAPLIGHVAKTLKENPEIDLLEVSGHADSRGNAERNLVLTRQRAEAVVEALGRLGIEKKRLRAMGYGSYCPRVEGDTAEARDKNRRVEFKIIRRGGVETGVELGCAAAKSGGVVSGAPPPESTPKHATPGST